MRARPNGWDAGGGASDADGRRAAEAIAALGYARAEARRWVDEALASEPDLETVEELTLAVLRARGG